MFLEDYIEKLKHENIQEISRPWITPELINKEFFKSIYPNQEVEEWKNFNIESLKSAKFRLPNNNDSLKNKDFDSKYNNVIVFNNGIFSESQSENKILKKINIFKISEYKNLNEEILNKIYSKTDKYSEERLSGISDCNPTKLLSLNTLLNNGIILEIPSNTVIDEKICIYNNISSAETFVNPYLLIILRENSAAKLLDLTSYKGSENWTNFFYEVYLEDKSDLHISNLSLDPGNNINTASYNFHLEEHSKLNFSLINKGISKKDIRVFLNGRGSKINIKGMLLSKKKESNDVFCKITHNNTGAESQQQWRMISSDSSKTSLNGKIKILRGAKKSTGSFFSKSLLLNEKARSFSKPELEIFEDEVACSHGASFGEIEKEKLFYLQSRGLMKKDAIKSLVLAFLNELDAHDKYIEENIISEIENLFFNNTND